MIESILELQRANGSNKKLEVLRKYSTNEWFCKILYYALAPTVTYNVSEKTLRAEEALPAGMKLALFTDIFECCEFLSRLRGVDVATLRQVKLFLYNYCDEVHRELYIKILSKTLRLGVTAKTVNKVIDNLIPEWEVQQAYPIEKYPIEKGAKFWVTEKLNGVRATLYKGCLFARSGVPYHGLDHIISELRWAASNGFVLDGELTLLDKGEMTDNEAFRAATGILNSDNEHKTEICYTIFDIIPIKDFDSLTPTVDYSKRRELLDSFEISSKYTKILPVLYSGYDQAIIDRLLNKMVEEDKEGLIVNLDVPYRRTRHRGILKVKRFYTMDLPIIRCEEGSGRLSGTLGALVLDYKGNEVRVGSGFSDELRTVFWQNKDSLIGSLCEVKYKEISSDKGTGLESLQFPVYVGIRDDKSEVSYG